jgi:hypothetical protein
MFGCTLLVCALRLIMSSTTVNWNMIGGTHRVRSQMLPSSLGWCLGMTQRTTVMGRIVGKPYLGICPSCVPNLPCAKTGEVQFDFVSQESGHEGAVSNAVTTP